MVSRGRTIAEIALLEGKSVREIELYLERALVATADEPFGGFAPKGDVHLRFLLHALAATRQSKDTLTAIQYTLYYYVY
ncbi:hypothetical protein EV132_12614 [Rhizobium sullae]|uniref:Uncharacterized protein n=1 Tax=Rhizobium sullae TaxID=50338 RepID=A0A4R3PSA6_RHISU|nr:hypothetical protein EV132_12614 [Rhizobium sullae]